MEQLDSLMANSSWSLALQHVHQHGLDPCYIPYLAQQQFLHTPIHQLDLPLFLSLSTQINDSDWLASASFQVARTSNHLPLVQAAIKQGRAATDKLLYAYEQLQTAVEQRDVEAVRELCSLDEGVRKVCLIEKGLIELEDRVRTWVEIWGATTDDKVNADADADAEKDESTTEIKPDDQADDDDDDQAGAWGSLDLPPSTPPPRPSTPPTPSLSPPCSLSTFLTEPLSTPALELAATSSLPSLLTLITRHSSLLWPLRTCLLLAIPEWEEPISYLPLLTGVAPDGRERKWVGQPWRSEPEFMEKVFEAPKPSEEDLQDRRTKDELTRVYKERIESVAEMGLISVALSLVQHCASVEVPGLEELGEELSLLSRLVYDRPPPSSPPPEQEEEEIYTLSHWRSLSPSQILQLYLSTSTPQTIAPTIQRLVLPYLSVLESRLERSGTPDPSLSSRLLNSWILDLSSPSPSSRPGSASAIDRLQLVETIFQHSKPTLPLPQRLVRNDEDLARLALAIIYGSTLSSPEALVLMGKIFECLPAFPDSTTSSSSSSSSSPPFDLHPLFTAPTPPNPTQLFTHLSPLTPSALSLLLDTLDLHLSTAESFSRYSAPVAPSWFLVTHYSAQRQRAWATRLARTAARGSGLGSGRGEGAEGEGEGAGEGAGSGGEFESEDEWVGLMEEMVRLTEGGEGEQGERKEKERGQGKAFWLLTREEVLSIFFGGLLGAGRISLARSLFSGSSSLSLSDRDDPSQPPSPPLEPKIVEELVIAASREFYDNAEEGNVNEGEMKLALECLSAAPQTPLIRQERDFILATSQLCSYNLTSTSSLPLTPIEIRLSKDRLSFVARLLSSNEDAFKHPEVLLELVDKLGYKGDRLARVRTLGMVAEQALACGEWERTEGVCRRMCEEVESLRLAALSPSSSSDVRTEQDKEAAESVYHSSADYTWRACFQLGKHEEWEEVQRRLGVMGRALILCPGERIGALLGVWEGLEERVEEGRERSRKVGEKRRVEKQEPTVQHHPDYHHQQQQQHDPTATATASRTFSRAAAFFPFSTSHSHSSTHTDPPSFSSSAGRPESPASPLRAEHEREREGGLRAGLSSRLTKGVGWLIGADERELEREGAGAAGWE